jgi:hypothetical protein
MKRGCADTSIFDEVNELCIASEFERPVLIGGELHSEMTPAATGFGSI